MGRLSENETLLDAIYASATEPAMWQRVQSDLCRAVDAIGSMYYLFDKLTQRFVALSFVGHTPALAAEYSERYHALDPHVPIAYTVPERKWFASHEYLDDSFVSRSEYFNDFSIPNGVRHVLGARLWETERVQAALAFQRGVDQTPFPTDLCRELDELSPHFARASRTHYRLHEVGLAREISASVLDTLDSPVCVVDESARLVYANAKGEALLKKSDALSVLHGGAVKACCGRCDQLLRRTIAAAADGRPGGLQLLDRKGQPAFNVAVVWLRQEAAPSMTATATRVLLVMTAAHARCAPSECVLQQMFGLTQAEAHLAYALAEGKTAEEYANRQHRSMATIRTQMRALYAKTGARGLSELLLLLGRLPPVGG